MAGQISNFQADEGFDYKKYLLRILTNWPLFIISLLIAYSIAYLINRYTEPTYTVSATLMINDDKKTGAELLIPSLARLSTQKNLENEVATLKSYSLNQWALSELDFSVSYNVIGRVRESKLYRAPFTVEQDSSKKNAKYVPVYIILVDNYSYMLEFDKPVKFRKLIRYGEKYVDDNFSFTIHLTHKFADSEYTEISKLKYFFYFNDLNALTNAYMAKLAVVTGDKKSSLLSLYITGAIPEQDVVYLNKLCDVYLRNNLDEKNRASINAIKFIDSQLAQISDSLKKVETRLLNFRLEHKVFDFTVEGSELYNRVRSYANEKLGLELTLKYCQYLKNYIDNRSNFSDIMAPVLMGVSEPILSAAVSELVDLYKQRNILNINAKEDNPNVNVINMRVKGALATLNENLNEIVNTSNFKIKSLNEKIADSESHLFSIPLTERQYSNIKREFDINNSIFSFLLQKRAEAGISKASNIADNKIVDFAKLENAVLISPMRSNNYMNALLLGLLIPLGIILLMEFLNNKITEVKDINKLQHCSFIGSIGHNDKNTDIPVFEFPKSALAESFRALRTNLQYLLREKDKKIILITSTISGEGKTFCAINLATILAMSNKKTVLLALDLRRPRIHKSFNLSNEIGISTYLIHQNVKEEIVLPTNINNLYFVSSGPTPPNPAELLETETMQNFIRELQSEYDYVILDTPPIAIVTDAILLSNLADVSIFVVRQNFTAKDALLLADDMAEKGTMSHLSLLLNDVKVPGYYGYSYRYGTRYGYQYGYGYSYYSYGHDYYGETSRPKTFKEKLQRWLNG